eukprot:2654175-Rhodomonas_salina.1
MVARVASVPQQQARRGASFEAYMATQSSIPGVSIGLQESGWNSMSASWAVWFPLDAFGGSEGDALDVVIPFSQIRTLSSVEMRGAEMECGGAGGGGNLRG